MKPLFRITAAVFVAAWMAVGVAVPRVDAQEKMTGFKVEMHTWFVSKGALP